MEASEIAGALSSAVVKVNYLQSTRAASWADLVVSPARTISWGGLRRSVACLALLTSSMPLLLVLFGTITAVGPFFFVAAVSKHLLL